MITVENSQGKLVVTNDGGYPCIAIYGTRGGLKAYMDFPDEDAMLICKELMK